jgi:hypothetical protein
MTSASTYLTFRASRCSGSRPSMSASGANRRRSASCASASIGSPGLTAVGSRRLRPRAADFRAALSVGAHDDRIHPADAGGALLAAIQGLQELVSQQDRELDLLRAGLEAIERDGPGAR